MSELLWYVDDKLVEKRTVLEQLVSQPRPNLTADKALDCSQAIQIPENSSDSGDGVLPVKDIGRHSVTVQARVTAAPSAANLFQYAADSVLNLVNSGGAAADPAGDPGLSGPPLLAA